LGMHLSRRVTVTEAEPERPERGVIEPIAVHDPKAPRRLELLGEPRDERCPIAQVRMARALERLLSHQVERVGETKLLPARVAVGREQSSRMIEMEVREDDEIDVALPDPECFQALDQAMAFRRLNAEP